MLLISFIRVFSTFSIVSADYCSSLFVIYIYVIRERFFGSFCAFVCSEQKVLLFNKTLCVAIVCLLSQSQNQSEKEQSKMSSESQQILVSYRRFWKICFPYHVSFQWGEMSEYGQHPDIISLHSSGINQSLLWHV